MALVADVAADSFLEMVQESKAPFPARLDILVETGPYLVKTASSFCELKQAFQLRHEVFINEGLGRRLPSGLDIEIYDQDSDHLLIIHKGSGRVIGNYRVRCSLFHRRFYCESEFLLDDFLHPSSPPPQTSPTGGGRAGTGGGEGVKIEIGRACVCPSQRDGLIIHLLWRGLREYVRQTSARYIFGCSSVPANVPGWVEAVWSFLIASKKVSEHFRALPRIPFDLGQAPGQGFEPPSLLASYLRFGAVVLGPPAFDADLDCGDFLTLLDVHDIPANRMRKYDV